MREDLAIYCADIGSIGGGNFGWAGVLGRRSGGDKDISNLVDSVVDKFSKKIKVALGFECPLWVPVPNEPCKLTSPRKVDEDKPWSAKSGPFVLATGLTETAWILRQLRTRLKKRNVPPPPAFLKWEDFVNAETGILLWEAFVAGNAKVNSAQGDAHVGDALHACITFRERLPNPEQWCPPEPSHPVRSLIGSALLWSGWSDNLELLRMRCLVVKPTAHRH